MIYEKVNLYEYFGIKPVENAMGILNCYIPDDSYEGRIRPAILVLAGGGYCSVSDREKEIIAFTFLANSFTAFTLEYSVAPIKYPTQLLEACMAMIYIRENAEKYHVYKDRIADIGFSAGGHLAAMLATVWNEKEVKDILGDKCEMARPEAAVLCYPVISSGEKAHRGSFVSLCGEDKELAERLSLEKRVTEKSSPAFIWATVNDMCVPSENSLMMAAEYKKHGVPFELHMFEDGQHGLSVATDEVQSVNEPVQAWVDMCITWLRRRGFVVSK